MIKISIVACGFFTGSILFASCGSPDTSKQATVISSVTTATDSMDYFLLRPKVEKEYGYSHAVKIGNHLKISGAVSMDSAGVLVARGNLEQQMKNCYSDLMRVLAHYGYSIEDVYAENIYTTDMAGFIKIAGGRSAIYKKNFPTGTWLEVKGLALQGQLIEIDMEAYRSK